MIIRTALYISVAAAAAFGGYQFLLGISPTAAKEIGGVIRNNFIGWNDEACTDNPLPCLKDRFGKLKGLEVAVEQSIVATRSQKDSLSAIVIEQEETFARNQAFLNEGKAIFKQNAGKGVPVNFAGRTYPTENSFKQQLGLLFQEKSALAKSLESTKAFETKLQAKLEGLMVQSANITLAKRMIPAQIELVRANTTLADFGENLEMINGIIKGSEIGLRETDQLIRTTKDLMHPKEASTTARPIDKELDRFLSE